MSDRYRIQKNITNFNIYFIPIIIIAKVIRWTVMYMQLVAMSIGNGIAWQLYIKDIPPITPFGGVTTNALVFFNAINFFGVVTTLEWEIYISILFNIILYLYIKKYYNENPNITWKENLFIYLNVGILNIFALCLAKEPFQLAFWFLMGFAINSAKQEKTKKILFFLILALTVVFSRKYYALIGIYFVVANYYIEHVFKNIKFKKFEDKLKTSWKVISLFLIFGLFHFAFVGYLASEGGENYETVASANNRFNEAADSAIRPIFEGNSFLFTLDYFVKIFRLTFPVELLVKAKATYIITIIYEALLAVFIIRALIFENVKEKQIEEGEDDEELLTEEPVEEDNEEESEDEEEDAAESESRKATRSIALYIYLGFLLCSAMFEPDFGSWMRHQSVAFPVILFLL